MKTYLIPSILFYILASVVAPIKLLVGEPFFTEEFSSQTIENINVISLPQQGFAIIWLEKTAITYESSIKTQAFSYFGSQNLTTQQKLTQGFDYAEVKLKSNPINSIILSFLAEKKDLLNNNCSSYSLYYQQLLSSTQGVMNEIFLGNFSIENQQNYSFFNIFDVGQIQKKNEYILVYKEKDCLLGETIIKGQFFSNLGLEFEIIGLKMNGNLSQAYKNIIFVKTKALKKVNAFLLVYLVENNESQYDLLSQFFHTNGANLSDIIEIDNFGGDISNFSFDISRNNMNRFIVSYLTNTGYYTSILDGVNYKFVSKFLIINNENISVISSSLLTNQKFIILYDLGNSLGNETIYEI